MALQGGHLEEDVKGLGEVCFEGTVADTRTGGLDEERQV